MTLHAIQAKAEMLIRRPVEQVYEAFINPQITTKFWFTKSSGRLDGAKQVEWTWEMYGASAQVTVMALEPNKRIVIEWDGYNAPTNVEWEFIAREDGTTFVSITNDGFTGDDQSIAAEALDSTSGFTIVLAGLKAYLEHNICLNLIADRFPDKVVT